MNKKKPIKKAVTVPVKLAVVEPEAATHVDRIKTALDELRPNITTGDRRALEQVLGLTKSTISKYLSGNIMKLETGLEILIILKTRVTDREDRLKTISV